MITQEEADELLQMLKSCVSTFLNLPSIGNREQFELTAINNKSKRFMVSVNRANKFVEKISFTALYKEKNIRLLRLDINPTQKHTNPIQLGGEELIGTHLHIYKEGFHDKYAIPFDVTNPQLEKIFFSFLEQFNVIKIPPIRVQISDKEV